MSSPVDVVAVGDLQLGDSPTTVGYGFFSRYASTSIEPLFADVKERFAGADVVFGNLETTLSPPPSGASSRSLLQLRGQPQFAADLRRVGFTVLNVANNHAVQHGDDSFRATVAAVRQAGIACCGVRGTQPWASEPARLSIRGREVGILGYCLRPRQYGADVPPYAEGDLDSICADVARLAQSATVIVSLHWGEEFVSHPSRDEVRMGRAIIDAGASVILGHHPHVARPVEAYKSGIIAYSLGNFIGDMVWYEPFRRGLMIRCAVQASGAAVASVSATRLRDDFRPIVAGVDEPVISSLELTGLDPDAYAKAIGDTMRRQRIRSYQSALVNIRRTPLRILAQLAVDTLRNKTGVGQSPPSRAG